MALNTEEKKNEPDSIQYPFYFKLRNVPNDHSCLFHSIGYLLDNSKYTKDIDYHYELRKQVSDVIVKQKEQYKQELIDANKTANEYSKWITDQFSWGGIPDATILARHYNVELVVMNVTANIYYILNANDSNNDRTRIHIIYNGDHYDAAVGIWNENNDLDVAKEIRQFNLKQLNENMGSNVLNWEGIQENVLKPFINKQHQEYKKKKILMDRLKNSKQYTCQDCDLILKSNEEMEQHMNDTSFEHCMFDEI
eukprot:287554_1